jgi:ABC-type sugar transport system ATPase subunit
MLEITGFSKAFNSVVVLDSVDFTLLPGEVHAVLGENGAGKSTLINLILGSLPRSAGRMVFKGQTIDQLDPQTARELGISAVFQEFSLAPDLTVAENLFLGREHRMGPFLRVAGCARMRPASCRTWALPCPWMSGSPASAGRKSRWWKSRRRCAPAPKC